MSISQSSPVKSPESLPPAGGRRRGRPFLIAALSGLVAVLVLAGFLGQHLLLNSQPHPTATFPSGQGPYAQLPLSAQQIDAIQHLSTHMKYRALASLYVSHLSLDEKLGQLIMLEFNEPAYSDNLDYAINTLHVGGVIMYDIQLNTFKQAKGDIAHMQART